MSCGMIAAKLQKFIPRALAGDPTAIAILATAGIIVAGKYIKDNL